MHQESVNIALNRKRQMLVAFASMMLYMNIQCMTFAVNIIAPTMLTALDGMKFYALAPVLNSLAIMLSAPVAGKMGDQFGRKWITLSALFCQHLMFALVAVSSSMGAFFLFFTLASVCGGFYISAPFAIMGDVIPQSVRARYYGYLAAFGAVGAMLGPFLSGLLVDGGVYRIAYILGIPVGLLTFLLLLRFYPNVKGRQTSTLEKTDIGGLILLIASVAPLALYVSCGRVMFPYLSVQGGIMVTIGIVSGFLFFRRERRIANPIVEISLFRYRRFTIAWACRLLFTAYLTGSTTYIVLYSQTVLGTSATVSSTFSMPQTAVMVLASPLIGRWVGRRVSRYKQAYMIIGLCAFATLAGFSMLRADSHLIIIYLGMAVGGIAYATEQTISTPYFQMDIPMETYGAAQGLSFFASSAGGVIWGAVYAALLAGGAEASRQIPLIFRTGAVGILLIFLIGVFGVKNRGKEE